MRCDKCRFNTYPCQECRFKFSEKCADSGKHTPQAYSLQGGLMRAICWCGAEAVQLIVGDPHVTMARFQKEWAVEPPKVQA